jgi:hypothetical protein
VYGGRSLAAEHFQESETKFWKILKAWRPRSLCRMRSSMCATFIYVRNCCPEIASHTSVDKHAKPSYLDRCLEALKVLCEVIIILALFTRGKPKAEVEAHPNSALLTRIMDAFDRKIDYAAMLSHRIEEN